MVACIDWHPACDLHPTCIDVTLAQKAKAPSKYFINTLSVYSRVVFIKNDKLPTINDVQTMAVVDDIDFMYQ